MRTLTIALSAVCVAALAVTVPQASIDDYFFSRPNCTNLTGTVIGEPPAYTTLRREDIAWLREAAAERAALQSRSWNGLPISIKTVPNKIGSFPLSSSNTFSRYVTAKEWVSGSLQTNIVVGYNSVTNMGSGIDVVRLTPNSQIDIASGLSFGSGFSGYLSPNDTDWLQTSQTVKGENLPWHTNIVTNVTTSYPSYYWGDNGYTDNTTQCVGVITMRMTNGTVSVWTNSWRVPLPLVETRATTNTSWGLTYDLLFLSKQIVTYDAPKPEAFSGIPRYSTVTNWYGYLRGMSRLAEEVYETNWIKVISASWYDDEWEGEPWHGEAAPAYYSIGINGGTTYDGTGWGYGQWPEDVGHDLGFSTSFNWDLVHTGSVNRISSATLYIVVTGISESEDEDEDIAGYYAKNMGSISPSATPDQWGKVSYSKTVNFISLYKEAASALGMTFPNLDGTDTCYRFIMSMAFYIVFDMAPWASLPGWGNQQGEPSP